MILEMNLTLHDGGSYHIETSPLICYANQWTGFYMMTAPVMKELNSLGIRSEIWQRFQKQYIKFAQS